MTFARRGFAGLLVALVGMAGLVPAAPAQAATRISLPLRSAVSHLPVASHTHVSTYDRTRGFGEWTAQGNGCDTRAVVLKSESLTRTTQNSYCTVSKGKWYSYYDGRYYYSAYGGAVQIDHMVPTENAWVSGAWRWTKATRVAFYNDLGDRRSLAAVDRHDNEAKGDRDPSQWTPSHNHCRYIRDFTAVKIRWHLTVTRAEKSALTRYAGQCSNGTLSVTRATIRFAG